jgi:hypothetical protein
MECSLQFFFDSPHCFFGGRRFPHRFFPEMRWFQQGSVHLLAINPTNPKTPQKALANVAGVPLSPANAVPSTRGPVAKSDAKRSIVEFCCHPESKLSQTNRKWSDGCEVLQFTKEFYLNEIDNQIRVAEYVNSFEGDVKPLIWISLPCAGGTPWTYINMRIPSAREKILKHIREFDRLWISSKSFLRMLSCDFHIALEWNGQESVDIEN